MINREDNPEFLNSFLDYSTTILNKSPNTVKEYNYDICMFLKFLKIHFHMTNEEDFSKIPVQDFSVQVLKKVELNDIYAFLAYLTSTYNSKASTRARKASSIRVFFKYLTRKAKLLEVNPAQDLESPKLDKRLPKYLSLEDSKKLLSVASNEDNRNEKRDYAILTLFLNCGMRLSELVGINIPDINFSECTLTVIGKGNKERTIYLNKACMKAIQAYLEVRPNKNIKSTKNSKNALFLSERLERISNRTVQHIVEKELRLAGFDTKRYSVHKLRHTAATLMYQYGDTDILTLQEILGHESISTTQIYTHLSHKQARQAAENNPLADL